MRFMFFKLNPAAANRRFSDEAAVLNEWGSTFKLSGAELQLRISVDCLKLSIFHEPG